MMKVKTLLATNLPWMLHLLKVMMFWVRVPVLSEKMYWIWPSSSFSVVVLPEKWSCEAPPTIQQVEWKFCGNLV